MKIIREIIIFKALILAVILPYTLTSALSPVLASQNPRLAGEITLELKNHSRAEEEGKPVTGFASTGIISLLKSGYFNTITIEEAKRVLAWPMPDFEDKRMVLTAIWVYTSILNNFEMGTAQEREELKIEAAKKIKEIDDAAILPKDLEETINPFINLIDSAPLLFSLLKRVNDYVSKTPDYFLFQMEKAVYETRHFYKHRYTGSDDIMPIAGKLGGPLDIAPIVLGCIRVDKVGDNDYLSFDEIMSSLPPYIRVRFSDISDEDKVKVQRYLHRVAENYFHELQKFTPDIVFRPESGLVFNHKGKPYVFLSNFSSSHGDKTRLAEIKYNNIWFKGMGYEIIKVPDEYPFEGGAEVKYVKHGESVTIIMGWGYRTSYDATVWIEEKLKEILGEEEFKRRIKIIRVKEAIEEAYHLDTALREIPRINESGEIVDETVMYYPEAFTHESQRVLRETFPDALIVSENDFHNFAVNSPIIGKTIVMDNRASRNLEKELEKRGMKVRRVNLLEFIKAGGGGKCLVCELDDSPYSFRFGLNRTIQMISSPRGVFDVQHINNAHMSGTMGRVNKGEADRQHANLVKVLESEGAEILFMDTTFFRTNYDFNALWNSVYSIERDETIKEETRLRLERFLDLIGGYIGVGEVFGIWGKEYLLTDKEPDISDVESIAVKAFDGETIRSLDGIAGIYELVKEIAIRYNKFYNSTVKYPDAALNVSLYEEMKERGVLGKSSLKIGEKTVELEYAQDAAPALDIVSNIEEVISSLIESGKDHYERDLDSYGKDISLDSFEANNLFSILPRGESAKKGEYYIGYDTAIFSPDYGKIIKRYSEILEEKGFKVRIMPYSSAKTSDGWPEYVLFVKYYESGSLISQGRIGLDINKEDAANYFLRLMAMLNLAVARANIPSAIEDSDLNERYSGLLNIIKREYKAISGKDLEINTSGRRFKEKTFKWENIYLTELDVKLKSLDIPDAYRLPMGKIDEYNRLSLEFLSKA